MSTTPVLFNGVNRVKLEAPIGTLKKATISTITEIYDGACLLHDIHVGNASDAGTVTITDGADSTTYTYELNAGINIIGFSAPVLFREGFSITSDNEEAFIINYQPI